MVLVDVVEDWLGEEGGLGGRQGLDLLAELGGADVVFEVGEQVELGGGVVGAGETEAVGVGGGVEGYAGGQAGGGVAEIFAGAGGDDEVCEEGDIFRAMPLAEVEESVRADEEEELAGGGERLAQGFEGFRGVVGAGRSWSVGERDAKVGLAGDGELGHGGAVFKRCGSAGGFEGLKADGSEENLIELKGLLGGAGDG